MATEVVEDGVLKSVVLDEGETSYATSPAVRIVGARAIGADFAADTVTLSDECDEVRDFAFFNNGHIRTLNIGRGLRTISSHSFAYRNALEKIEVSADNDTFSSVNGCLCDKAGETVHLGVNAEVMELPATCRAVDENAFAYCGGIRTLKLDSALESIGAYAFCDCSGIENVYVSANVVEIGKGAFCGCGRVDTITVDGSRNAGGTNIVDLLKVAFADIGKVSQVKITGRVGKIALLLGDGTFANTDIDTLVDTGSRPADEWPYAKKYRNEDQTVTATFRYADPSDPSQVTEQQVTVSPGMPFGAIPLPGQFVGFTFDGWFYENQAEFGKQPITRDSIVKPMGDFTVVAKYVVEECLVRFYDSDGTTVLEEYTVEYGDTVTTPPSPAFDPDEYTFKGWLLEGTTDHYPAGETIIVRSNMDFVARIVPIGLFDYEVVSTPTSTSVSVFGFNPYWSDDEITSELETSAGIYQLAIPDTMRVRVSGSMKTVKVRTVGYEPIYYDGVQIEPSDPHATKPDGTPLKPFGYFGDRIIFKDVTLGTNVTKVNDYAFKGFRSGKLILPYALARIGNYAFAAPDVSVNECEVRMENRLVDGVLEDNYDAAMCPVGENFVKVGEGAFRGIAAGKDIPHYQVRRAYNAGDLISLSYYDWIDASSSVWRVKSNISASENTSFDAIKNNDKIEEYARFFLMLSGNVSLGRRAFDMAGIDRFDNKNSSLSMSSVPANCFSFNPTMTADITPIQCSSVGESAFLDCYALRAYPCHAEVIGKNAFYDCKMMGSLGNLENGPKVTSIGDYAFYSIGSYAFEYLSLSTSSLDNAVIGTYAFFNSSINSLDINPETIKSYAFAECWNLTSVRLSVSQTQTENIKPLTIMSYAFYGEYYMPLGELYVGRCISIGKYAFANNGSMTYAEISAPEGMRCDIGASAFRDCWGLWKLKLSGGGEIGSSCFRNCSNLTTVTMAPVSIGDAAFYNNTSLRHLVMSTVNLRNIGVNVFRAEEGYSMNPDLFWMPIADVGVYGLALEVQDDPNEEVYRSSGYSWLVHSMSTPEVVNLDSVEHQGVTAASTDRRIAGIAQKTFRGKVSGGTRYVYLPNYDETVLVEGGSDRLKPHLCLNSFSGFTSLDVYMPSPCSIAEYAFDVADLYLHVSRDVLAECEFDTTAGWLNICTGTIHFVDEGGSEYTPELVIKGDVASGQFTDNYQIQSIVIEEGCQSIGDNAFLRCNNLSSIVIRPRTQPLVIGDYAFGGTSITSIDLSNFSSSSSSYDLSCTAFAGCPGSLFSEVLGMYRVVGEYIVSGVNPIDGNHIYPNRYTDADGTIHEWKFTRGVFDMPAVRNVVEWYVDSIPNSTNAAFDAGCLLSKETTEHSGKKYNNLRKVEIRHGAVRRIEVNRANTYADNEIELVLNDDLQEIRIADGVDLDMSKSLRIVWDADKRGYWWWECNLYDRAHDNPLSHGAKLYQIDVTQTGSWEALLVSDIAIVDGCIVVPYAFFGYRWATSVTFEDTMDTVVGRDAFMGMTPTLYDESLVAGLLVLDGWVVGLSEYGKTADGFDIAGKGIRGITNYAFAEHVGTAAVTAAYSELLAMAFTEESAYNTSGLILEVSGVRIYRGEIIGPASSGFTGQVDIPAQYEIGSIRELAFAGKFALTILRIRSGLVELYNQCLSGTYLTELSCSGGIAYIGPLALYGTRLTTLGNIQTNAISIQAFRDCKSLVSLIFTGVHELFVSNEAFRQCTSLHDILKYNASGPNTVLPIADVGDMAFQGCTSLEHIEIGTEHTNSAIGNAAFDGCTSLSNVEIDRMVASPGRSAFRNCPISNLKITGCILDSRGDLQTIETRSHFGSNIEVLQIVPRDGIVWIDMDDMVKLNTLSIENPDTVKVMWPHYDGYSWLGDDVTQEFRDKYCYFDSYGNVICIVDGWFMFIYDWVSGGLLDLTDYLDGEGNRMQVIGMATFAALGWPIEEVRFGAELQRLSICAFSNDGTYPEDYDLKRVVFYGNAPTISPDGYMWAETEEEAKATIFENCPIVSVYVTRGSTGWGVTPREPGSVYSITLIDVSSAGGAFRDAEHDVLGAAYPICWVLRESTGDRYFYTATDAPARGDAVFADSDGNQSAGTVEYTEDSGPKWCDRPIYYRN